MNEERTEHVGVPKINAAQLSPREHLGERELVVLGPSLGTSRVMWDDTARLIGDDYDVLAWDLPGHGISPAVDPADAAAPGAFTMAELAEAVLGLIDSIEPAVRFHYAGDSVGGAVGAELVLAHPERLLSLSMLCSSPKFATPESWNDRADAVAAQGTAIRIQASAEAWYGPGFLAAHPHEASRLLHALRDADRFGYAAVCRALAGYDVRDRFSEIALPFLAVAGEFDTVSPFSDAEWMAVHAQNGTAVEVPGVAHIAPTENPAAIADLLRKHFLGARQESGAEAAGETQEATK
ncbi:hypothetical protein GCM10027449_09980 [Sinomonas notoginsengisoli]|uniref:alpha/beta fold hydrolase n=1 Tax=Sinomonas notoginsengisoli TaxID=1457311 RepID=UPI001F33AE79|nr:alpha/beta fold hydrolase [Sinomonas notoginsengisoli]